MTVIVICAVKITSHTNTISHTTDTDNLTEDFFHDFDIFDDKHFLRGQKRLIFFIIHSQINRFVVLLKMLRAIILIAVFAAVKGK